MQNIDNTHELEETKLRVRCEKGELARKLAQKTTLKIILRHKGKWAVTKMIFGPETILFLGIMLVAFILSCVYVRDFDSETSILVVGFLLLSIGTMQTRITEKKIAFARERIEHEHGRYKFELCEELLRYIRETGHKSLDWPTDFEKISDKHPYWAIYDILEETRTCIFGDHADYLINNRISWTLIEMGNEHEYQRLIEAFANLRIALTESIKKWRTFTRQFHDEVELYKNTGISIPKKLTDSAQLLAKEVGDALKMSHLDTYKRKEKE